MKKYLFALIGFILRLGMINPTLDTNGNSISVKNNAMDEDLKGFLLFLGALLAFGVFYGLFHHWLEDMGNKIHSKHPNPPVG